MPAEPGTPQHWLEYAQADLEMARVPLPKGARYEQLCFFAQQAAEKAIKAVLIRHGIEAPRTHNIEALVSLLPDTVQRVPELGTATALTAYATATRYPVPVEEVDRPKYAQAVRLAEAVVAWAAEVIGVDAFDPSSGGEAP